MAEKKAKGGKKSGQKAAAKSAAKSTPKRPAAKKAAAVKPIVARPKPTRIDYQPREAKATQRSARQSPYKMRLVMDQIRGKTVNEALALLTFSKKHAAKQIEKV